VAANRVHVIPNAVLPAASSPADRQRYRAAWGFTAGEFVVGCVANYRPEKGLDMLIDAALRLHDLVPELRIVLVGEGPLRDELAGTIHGRGLDSVFRLHGAEPDARRVYTAFDSLVQASRTEGLPNVILEAAAAGLPIVATAVGGTAEVLTADRNALLVKQGDAGGMAVAIRRLAENPDLRERLGRAARDRAAEFSVERLVTATTALYLGLAGRLPREEVVSPGRVSI
jgi:glycosyltransferase involved in cell wall biosynthesis